MKKIDNAVISIIIDSVGFNGNLDNLLQVIKYINNIELNFNNYCSIIEAFIRMKKYGFCIKYFKIIDKKYKK